MEELNDVYEGLQQTFKKLKERKTLTYKDIQNLQNFADTNVTCSTSLRNIKKMFKNTEDQEYVEEDGQ